jgi:hypothetical protein
MGPVSEPERAGTVTFVLGALGLAPLTSAR